MASGIQSGPKIRGSPESIRIALRTRSGADSHTAPGALTDLGHFSRIERAREPEDLPNPCT